MTQRPLIGTSPNQISTNGMLGDLAFQDSNGAYIETIRGSVSLDKLDKEITDTAVDVFVYDTRKDSDGGQWRHRCQHTSWYNETLNTATRGSRREFPAVAVIVAEGTKLTIYDGDDPDMPMWMRFTSTAGVTMMQQDEGSGTHQSVVALNGKVVTCHGSGTNHSSGVDVVDFIKDNALKYRDSTAVSFSGLFRGDISQRNNDNGWDGGDDQGQIVSSIVNDLAITVLPNAPIDSTTGLPIPTIAVATNGGISVIKDDGTVISTSDSGYYVKKINFTKDYGLNVIITNSSNGNWVNAYVNDYSTINGLSYITYNNFDGVVYRTKYDPKALTYLTASTNDTICNFISLDDRSNAIGVAAIGGGLTILEKSPKLGFDPDEGMVAFATTSYNTGWMHGNIKGAFLSDTTAESFSPSNLVTEDFSANWAGSTGGVLSVSSGQLTITNTGSNGRAVSNQFATTTGKKYAFIVKGISSTGGGTYRSEVRGPELVAASLTAGTLVLYFNGTGNSTTYVELYAIGGSGVSVTYENAYVVELEEDRSVNNKGLQVFGTITKSAVATGAELVGYSGFSNSTNYLSRPLNSDLAIGNSDFSCVGWFKKSTSSNTGMILYASDGNNQVFDVRVHTDMKMLAQITDDNFSTREIVSAQGPAVNDNIWHQYHVVRRSNTLYSYLDGNLLGSSATVEANITNSMGITIGAEGLTGHQKAFEGSISLIRFSQSAPSTEQIRKIYEDEKVLFQENAACTLYGSSDAVTALAYDDTTSLLHVGTSSGRSEFKGLRRVANTTTAVTTAISASNGLVAEQ